MTSQSGAVEGSTRRSVLRTSAVGVGALMAGGAVVVADAAPGQAASATSAARYFLTISGIPGSSTDKTHAGSIELIDASWGLTVSEGSESGGVNTPPRTTFSAFHFTAYTDIDSPLLFLACASLREIASARLEILQSPTAPANITVILERVQITAYTNRDTSSLHQVDEVSLSFRTISYRYAPILASGVLGPEVVATWNVPITPLT